MSKQQLSNFQAENSYNPEQLEAKIKNIVACNKKKNVYDIKNVNFATITGLNDDLQNYMANANQNESIVSSGNPICLCIYHTEKRNTKMMKLCFKKSTLKQLIWYFYFYIHSNTADILQKRSDVLL